MEHLTKTVSVVVILTVVVASVVGCQTALTAADRAAQEVRSDSSERESSADDTERATQSDSQDESTSSEGASVDLPSVTRTTSMSIRGPDLAERDADDVDVYDFDANEDELPAGIYFGGTDELVYESGYPTEEDPIEEVADLRASSTDGYTDDEIRLALREAAGEMGANVAVLNIADGTGVAVYIPDVEPAEIERDPEVLLAQQADEASERGYSHHIDTRRLDLANLSPLRIDTAAGQCHAIGLALDTDAELNWQARQTFHTDFYHPDEHIQRLGNNPGFSRGSGGTSQVAARDNRSAWTAVGCATVSGELVVEFYHDEPRGPEADQWPDFGDGEMIVEIYRDNRGVDEIEGQREAAQGRSEENRERVIEDNCRDCIERHRCYVTDGDVHGCEPFERCMERRGTSEESCRERNLTP